MKKIWVVLLLLTLFSVPGCQQPAASQRPEVLAYLKSSNAILNGMPQVVDFPNISNDLGGIDKVQSKNILTQNSAKYQSGLQLEKAEKVPDIAEVKACHETGANLSQEAYDTLQKMLAALNANNPADYAKAAYAMNAMRPEVSAFYRQIESLLTKYSIQDSEVDFRFRGK